MRVPVDYEFLDRAWIAGAVSTDAAKQIDHGLRELRWWACPLEMPILIGLADRRAYAWRLRRLRWNS